MLILHKYQCLALHWCFSNPGAITAYSLSNIVGIFETRPVSFDAVLCKFIYSSVHFELNFQARF